MTSNPYQGLINEGSTCYLNSLIQTLFMTPEFRKNVYSYVHNSKKLQMKNSIPYQLQKLFVLLQTSKTKLVTTRGLLKSFQWTEADAFQQHDVQQFCRKLFQAIEISNKKAHWITDLFQGTMVSYVDCGKHLSQKTQIFMDISLPIHNPYTKVKFTSLEQCLKQYLKSEKLEDKFMCEFCDEKVEVHKGMKICKLPPLLTIQLNRFQLNYETWQRQKINDFLYFPEILYMGKFMKKYEEIQISEIPAELKSKVKVTQKQKSARTTDMFAGLNNEKQPAEVPKIKPKRKNSDEIESSKAKVFFFEQQTKREKQTKKLTLQEEKQRNRQILADLKSEKSQIDKKMKIVEKIQNDNLEDDMLFGSGMGFLVDDGPLNWNGGAFEKKEEASAQGKPKFSKNEVLFEHQQEVFDSTKQYPDNTYMLYAVLVHSGGAYGGHYYAFISNGKDWFRFDDSIVRKVDRHQMRKYGNFDKILSGSNAYLLFYRDVKTFKQSNPDEIQIPQQLLQKVNNDKQPVTVDSKDQPTKKDKRFQQILQGVMLKLMYISPKTINNQQQQIEFNTIQPQSLFIQNRYQQTIGSLKQKVLSLYPQLDSVIGENNWRLRRYNKLEESLHEVYTENFNEFSLESLGFRQTVYIAIQTKTNQQEFQQYDPKQITVKINVWRPDITFVTEKHLKPIKLHISQQAPFTSLVKKICQKSKISNPVIIKRNFSQSNPIQIYPNTQTKKLIQLKFFNGINLYVQQPFIDNKSRWVVEFQSQKYRCSIKYNNPEESQSRDYEIYFDTRKTLKQLKQHLSKLINIPIEQFRIKKTRQSVSQLINYNKKLYDLKFIANQYLYLEKGRSSLGVVILKQGKVEIIDDRIQFNLGEEVIVELDETIQTVGDIITKLSQILKISPKLIRIREFKAFQFGQIYRHSQSIQKIKQKSLIWEKLSSQDLSEMRGLQLYVRIFDIINMQLGPLREIYVDNTATYQQFAYLIEQQLSIKFNKILVWKALSNYVEKSILLDTDWIEVGYIKRQIKQEPLYIMNDGQIVMQSIYLFYRVKQADKEYHARVNCVTGKVVGGGVERGKQAQLKITVMAQNSDQQQQMLKKALQQSMAAENNNNNNTQINTEAIRQNIATQQSPTQTNTTINNNKQQK